MANRMISAFVSFALTASLASAREPDRGAKLQDAAVQALGAVLARQRPACGAHEGAAMIPRQAEIQSGLTSYFLATRYCCGPEPACRISRIEEEPLRREALRFDKGRLVYAPAGGAPVEMTSELIGQGVMAAVEQANRQDRLDGVKPPDSRF